MDANDQHSPIMNKMFGETQEASSGESEFGYLKGMDADDQYYQTTNRVILKDIDAALSRIEIEIQHSFDERNTFTSLKQMQMLPECEIQEMEHLNIRLARSATRLTNHLSSILKELHFVVDVYSNIIEDFEGILEHRLAVWRQNQKLAGNGFPGFDSEYLNKLQIMCEDPVKMISNILQIRKQTFELLEFLSNCCEEEKYAAKKQCLESISKQLKKLLRSWINTTLVVKSQSTRVIKTGTTFSVEVCSLTAQQLLENTDLSPQGEIWHSGKYIILDCMSYVKMQAFIIDEKQAHLFFLTGIEPTSNLCEVKLDEYDTMKYYDKSKEFIAELRNIILNKFHRKEMQSTRDEKFAIMFSVTFKLIGEINITAKTISLPIIVIVHSNQESRALGSIFWDNAFSEPDLLFFNTPEIVPWMKLVENLSMICHSMTGRHLYPEEINHLTQKLIEYKCIDDFKRISWYKFCAENLPEMNFTFWKWFCETLKFIKEHLNGLWNDGLILGFISKIEAKEKLSQCSAGTFLLRFSDSVLGGISITAVFAEPSGQKMVRMLSPYSSDELAENPLANRICNAQNLLHLYPNISKGSVFERHRIKVCEC